MTELLPPEGEHGTKQPIPTSKSPSSKNEIPPLLTPEFEVEVGKNLPMHRGGLKALRAYGSWAPSKR